MSAADVRFGLGSYGHGKLSLYLSCYWFTRDTAKNYKSHRAGTSPRRVGRASLWTESTTRTTVPGSGIRDLSLFAYPSCCQKVLGARRWTRLPIDATRITCLTYRKRRAGAPPTSLRPTGAWSWAPACRDCKNAAARPGIRSAAGTLQGIQQGAGHHRAVGHPADLGDVLRPCHAESYRQRQVGMMDRTRARNSARCSGSRSRAPVTPLEERGRGSLLRIWRPLRQSARPARPGWSE